MHYNFIPQELREFRQWLCWKYENRGTGKLTKTPYSPITGTLVNVTDPNNLCSYGEAIANLHMFDGIGFSLLPTDPFCFIDFDSTTDLAEIEFQKRILETFDTYSEISPSGNGLHLICKASLPSGRRHQNTEIYTSGRYMTMTGNVYQNKPIAFKQTLASALWEELGRSTASAMQLDDYNEFSEKTDLEIYNIAQYAENGEKFLRLWNGDTTTYHMGDQSRADFALIDILAFYTQDREQIKRLFRLSALGQRAKAKREDYCETMISRAFDRILPSVDISAIANSMNDFLAQQPKPQLHRIVEEPVSVNNQLFTKQMKAVEALEDEKISVDHIPQSIDDGAFSIPPGLLGQVAKFIYDQAYKPIPEIAIVGAIGLLAGIAGRSYNVSSNGLNVYMLILAGTGRGKEAIASGLNKIIKSVQPIMPTIVDFIGPQDMASGQGLLRYMADHRTKSFVSVMGEFGIKLRTICDPKAMGADLMTQKVMLDMFSKSGKNQTIMPTVYSDSDRNTKPIDSPAFSLIGETQPSWFYNSLDDVWIRTGLLPRFTVIEYLGKRPPSNETCNEVIPSQSLIQNVCSLATAVYKLLQSNQTYAVPFSPEALELSRKLDRECDRRINDNDNDIIAELWSRCHLKVLRLAAIIAVGNNPYSPVIDVEAFEWAEKFIRHGTDKLASKFANGLPTDTPDESHQAQILIQYILRYLASEDHTKWKAYNITELMFKTRAIPYSYLTLSASRNKAFCHDKIGGTNAVKRAVQNLVDNGDLQEIPKGQSIQRFQFGGKLFVVPNGSNIYEQLKLKLHLIDD